MQKIMVVIFLGISLSLIGMEDQDHLLEQANVAGSEKSVFSRCMTKLFSYADKKTAVVVCIGTLLTGMVIGTSISAVNRTSQMNVPDADSSSDSSGLPECMTWHANSTLNPCSWIESAEAWAIANCQSDQMAYYNDDSCVPVCWNTLKHETEIQQSIPTGWNSREYYDSYGSCSSTYPDLNDIDMYLLCPSRWARTLKSIFKRDNISHCDITLENPAQQGFIIKAYETEQQEHFSRGMEEAVNLQAYMTLIADTPELFQGGYCRQYADEARNILDCEGPIVMDDDE